MPTTPGEQAGNRELIAAQWLKTLEGEVVSLRDDDSLQAIVKPVSIMGLVDSGKIPNSLLAQAQKMSEDSVEDTKPEELTEVADLVHIILENSMVFPRLAARDAEGNYTEERDPPDVIFLSDLGDEAIIRIVNYTQRGLRTLNKFREEQGPGDPSGSDGPEVLAATVNAAGN